MIRKHPNQTFNSTGKYRREVTLSQFIDETAFGDWIVIYVAFAGIFATVILSMLGMDQNTVMVLVFTPVIISFVVFWIMPRMSMKVVS